MKTIHCVLIFLCLTIISCQPWDLDKIDFPEVELSAINTVSFSSIEVVGFLKGLENGQVGELGFLWSEVDPEPAIDLVNTSKHDQGASFTNGSFSHSITDLKINRTYYIRAFAIYNNEPLYSEVLTYLSEANLSVENLGIQGIIRSQKAIAKAQIMGLPNGKTIQRFGHCWSITNDTPTILDFSINQGTSDQDTLYNSELGNLENGTTYFIRPFFMVEDIVIYGAISSFVKGDFWIRKGDIPDRNFFDAPTFAIGSKAYVINKITQSNVFQELWEYDTELDLWTYKTDLPTNARFRAVAFSLNGKGYIAYGEHNNPSDGYLNDIWEYDPNDASDGLDDNGNPKGKFTLKDVPQPGGERSIASVIVIDNRVFYGWGVYNNFSPDEILYNDLWEYLPNDLSNGTDANGNPNGAWSQRANYPGTPRFGIEGVGFEGNAHVFFGDTHEGNTQHRLESYAYDPISDQWTQKQSALVKSRTNPNTFILNNKIYTGLGTFENFTDFWQYDPSDVSNGLDDNGDPLGAWQEVTSFAGGPRREPASFQIGDRAFIFGGNIPGTNDWSLEMWEYVAEEE